MITNNPLDPFYIEEDALEHKITARFDNWQMFLSTAVEWSIEEEFERTDVKDLMVVIQAVIIGCRSTKKFQRDSIPADREITVRFHGPEFTMAKLVAQNQNRFGSIRNHSERSGQ